jgi:hypothetical protein
MANRKKEKETVFGLTLTNAKNISDQVFNLTDKNHPDTNFSDNRFMDILKSGKPTISASSIFVKRVSL